MATFLENTNQIFAKAQAKVGRDLPAAKARRASSGTISASPGIASQTAAAFP
jgi:hypothetical protein